MSHAKERPWGGRELCPQPRDGTGATGTGWTSCPHPQHQELPERTQQAGLKPTQLYSINNYNINNRKGFRLQAIAARQLPYWLASGPGRAAGSGAPGSPEPPREQLIGPRDSSSDSVWVGVVAVTARVSNES